MWTRLRKTAPGHPPFPAAWASLLQERVAAYARLNPQERARLHARIQVFLRKKRFVGCGGLQVTDLMRLTIAAQACRLELGMEASFYPHCRTIYLYPGAFMSRVTELLPGGVVQERVIVRQGESWHRGSVVLAWDAVEASAQGHTPGQNVVLHEFAHQLDNALGLPDGVPRLRARGTALKRAHARWAEVMREAYLRLIARLETGDALIDPYAATSPAEFFAVTTELFFDLPERLAAVFPEVYALLRDYYGQDPRQTEPPKPDQEAQDFSPRPAHDSSAA